MSLKPCLSLLLCQTPCIAFGIYTIQSPYHGLLPEHKVTWPLPSPPASFSSPLLSSELQPNRRDCFLNIQALPCARTFAHAVFSTSTQSCLLHTQLFLPCRLQWSLQTGLPSSHLSLTCLFSATALYSVCKHIYLVLMIIPRPRPLSSVAAGTVMPVPGTQERAGNGERRGGPPGDGGRRPLRRHRSDQR